MKTTLRLLALSVVVLFSSCASSDVAVLKRKYNSGFYVDFGNKKSTTESKEVASAKKENNKPVIIKQKAEICNEATVENLNNETVTYPLTASNDNKVYVASSVKAKKILVKN